MNVLFVITDQQRYDCVGYAGNDILKTPNIDWLAEHGTVFDAAYTPCPLCVPARSALLTGTYAHEFGGGFVREGDWTFVRELNEHGYHTAALGKMHFKPLRADHGFETMRIAEHDPMVPGCYLDDDYHKELAEDGLRDDPEEWQFPTRFVDAPKAYQESLQAVLFPHGDERHSTTWIGREAVRFLEAPKDRPFFAWVSTLRPHHPFSPSEPWAKMYPIDAMPLPDRDPGRLDLLPQGVRDRLSTRLAHRTFDLAYLDDALLRKVIAYYYATITHIDHWLGEMLRRVDLDDTLVIFTADHGEYLGRRNRLFKDPQIPFDDLARVPLVMAGPGVPRGYVAKTPVDLTAIAATVLEAAGIRSPSHSRSVFRMLEGESDGAAYVESEGAEGWVCVRRDRWKYMHHLTEGVSLLYDLECDPLERINLARMSEHRETVKRLHHEAMAWRGR